MDAIANTLNAGVTASELAGTIPNVGTMFVALILFSIGLVIFRKVLRGAKQGGPKM